jgi:hypothetical protein
VDGRASALIIVAILAGSIVVALIKNEAAGVRRRQEPYLFWGLLGCGGVGLIALALAMSD